MIDSLRIGNIGEIFGLLADLLDEGLIELVVFNDGLDRKYVMY